MLSAALAGGLGAGCAVGPDYQRPALDLPREFRGVPGDPAGPPDAASFADQPWWEVFRDPALAALIDEALRHGWDVRTAVWRVEELAQRARAARAGFFPALDLQAGYAHGQASREVVRRAPVTDTFQVGLAASWELDVWGRIRRLTESARAAYLASDEARRGVLLSIVAQVARGYFTLLELDERLAIAERTTRAFEETAALFERRLGGGTASALETARAQAALATAAATIPDLERQIAEQENALALLVGSNPRAIVRGVSLVEQPVPPAIPAGLPSALLERRPDVREAEQDLIAANADVGVAEADFFPRFDLTGDLGGTSARLAELTGNGALWSVGAGLTGPLFRGGRIVAEYRAAFARWEEVKARYESVVSNAFAEVSSALVAHVKLAAVEERHALSVAAYQRAVDFANRRYLAGLSSYVEVLDAQQQLFPAENALAAARSARLANLVQLYRSLGGGWSLSDPRWLPNGAGDASEPSAAAGR